MSGILLIQFGNILEEIQEVFADRILLMRTCAQSILTDREGIHLVVEVEVSVIEIDSFELIRRHVKSHT